MGSNAKRRMFIAEDSEIASQLEQLFVDDFNIVIARDGRSAVREFESGQTFDVCIIDVIMPVEDDEFSLHDADETGIRLIKRIVSNRVCSRIVILTVRWDVEEQIKRAVGEGIQWRLLLKPDADSEQIIDSVNEVLKA